jgi:hypothetical protein
MQTITLSDEQANLLRSIISDNMQEIIGDLNPGHLSDYSARLLNAHYNQLQSTAEALAGDRMESMLKDLAVV